MSILAVVAALVIGVNIGRQVQAPQTAQLPSTPSPTTVVNTDPLSYRNSFCKVAFDYPPSFTFLESASGSAAFTSANGDDGIILTCQNDVPRPAETNETVEDIRIGTVAAKLYNNQYVIFRHPGTKLDVFLAGSGEVFQNLLKTLTIF